MKNFRYFEPLHIQSFLFFTVVGIIIIALPLIFKKLRKTNYTKYFGIACILMKLVDSLYRIYFEFETPLTTLPLNLCNIVIILSGIYLITENEILFNLMYFYFLGAILSIILPGIITYYNDLYIYMFMGTHMLEIIAVIYGFTVIRSKITLKGLKYSLIWYVIISASVRIFNNIFGTNFMYLNDYILPVVSFIKPFWLYTIVLTGLFMISMVVLYLPFHFFKKKH